MNSNSNHTNYPHPYFKCILCKLFNHRKYNRCAIELVKNGEILCSYSTVFSIWKWFVRTVLFALAVLFIYFNIKYVWHYTLESLVHLIKYNEYKCTVFAAFCATIGWIELIGLIILISWLIFKVVYHIHQEFEDRGGKYW